MNIRFDVAANEHIPVLLEIEKLSWLSAYPNEKFGISRNMILERFASTAESTSFLEECIADSMQAVYPILSDAKIVGYLHLQEKNEYNDLVQIYLLPEYQGQGIGTTAMRFILSKFGSEKPIHLQVAKYNERAISLYKKYGFQVTDLPQPEGEVWNILPSAVKIPVIVMVKD